MMCCRCNCMCSCFFNKNNIEQRVIMMLGDDEDSIRKQIMKDSVCSAMFKMLCKQEKERMYYLR